MKNVVLMMLGLLFVSHAFAQGRSLYKPDRELFNVLERAERETGHPHLSYNQYNIKDLQCGKVEAIQAYRCIGIDKYSNGVKFILEGEVAEKLYNLLPASKVSPNVNYAVYCHRSSFRGGETIFNCDIDQAL